MLFQYRLALPTGSVKWPLAADFGCHVGELLCLFLLPNRDYDIFCLVVKII